MSAAGEGAAIIRALRPQDSRLEVSAIYEESWRWAYRGIVPQAYLDALPPGRWAAFIDTPGIYTLVADDGGALAGTASFCASRFPEYEGMGEIVSLYLREPYAGRGLGRALLKAAAAALAALGFEDIFLWVLEENARAQVLRTRRLCRRRRGDRVRHRRQNAAGAALCAPRRSKQLIITKEI